MATVQFRRASLWFVVCAVVLLVTARLATATVQAPTLRALELPPGAVSLSAADPLLVPILNGATTTGPGPVAHNQAGQTLPIGKTLVTWQDLSDGNTAGKYVYLYPHGWQVLGTTTNLRVFEHNGARHVLYDNSRRVHVIYNDGVDVWYRLGTPAGNRVLWNSPVRVSDNSTPVAWSTYGTRGQTFALFYDAMGNVNLHCVWSTNWPFNRAIVTRPLSVDNVGNVSAGTIVSTGLLGSFACIAIDSAGTFHLAVELYSAMTYMNSRDGLNWGSSQNWTANKNNCTAYRFPNLVIDSHDRVHLLWQAEGYQGRSGSALWWVGLYSIYNPLTALWSAPVNVLAGIPGWQMPTGSQDVLFAYPNMLLDDNDNLHLAWHGTARSFMFAEDDIYYMRNPYNPATDTWTGWADHIALHKRSFPGVSGGEDYDYSWVPSLAYRPGSSDIYSIFMFGAGDDEVEDPSVNLTDAGLKKYETGSWQTSFENVIQTPGMRSWYPNVPPTVMVDPSGRTWLDMVWVDGTKDDYNVMFRRIDLGGGIVGDVNGDSLVNIGDLQLFVLSWNAQASQPLYNSSADFNHDTIVNVTDLQLLIANWAT